MFERIVVPLDGSSYAERVLPYVVALAKGFRSQVSLLHILDLNEYLFAWRLSSPGNVLLPQREALAQQLPSKVEAAARVYLEEQAGHLREQGLAVSVALLYGDPAEVLVTQQEIGDEKAGLLAMCTHGRSGLARMFLGSVADRVLRGGRLPLLLVHPSDGETAGEIRQIVVALDGSAFAEAVLPYAQETAARLGVPMHVIQVLPSLAHIYLGTQIEIYPPDILEEVQGAAAFYLSNVASRLEKERLHAETHVLQGNADAAIIRYANERSGSLLALTTHGSSGIGRWMLGSVADKVVRSSHDPVLIIRPSQGVGT